MYVCTYLGMLSVELDASAGLQLPETPHTAPLPGGEGVCGSSGGCLQEDDTLEGRVRDAGEIAGNVAEHCADPHNAEQTATCPQAMESGAGSGRGGGLGSRPKKMYGERLGDGVEYHLMSPTPRR